MSEFVEGTVQQVGKGREFVENFFNRSTEFYLKCNKPDSRELKETAKATALGLLVLGVIGFLIKLIFIPVNNMLIGG